MDTDVPVTIPVDCSPTQYYYHLIGPPFQIIESTTTPTPGYDDAKKQFAEAAAKFAAHRFADAARAFLGAAQRLEVAQRLELVGDYPEWFREQYRSDRILAYENAAFAYENAKEFDEGRRALTQRVHQDPACAAELQRIVHDLNDWDKRCKPAQ